MIEFSPFCDFSSMAPEFKVGDVVEAQISRITDFGAFVKINGRNPGLIHISQIANTFVKDVNQHLKVGDTVQARVIKLGPGNKVDLSLKSEQPKGNQAGFARSDNGRPGGFRSSDFEEKLKKFLRQSQQSFADLKRRNEKYQR